MCSRPRRTHLAFLLLQWQNQSNLRFTCLLHPLCFLTCSGQGLICLAMSSMEFLTDALRIASLFVLCQHCLYLQSCFEPLSQVLVYRSSSFVPHLGEVYELSPGFRSRCLARIFFCVACSGQHVQVILEDSKRQASTFQCCCRACFTRSNSYSLFHSHAGFEFDFS